MHDSLLPQSGVPLSVTRPEGISNKSGFNPTLSTVNPGYPSEHLKRKTIGEPPVSSTNMPTTKSEEKRKQMRLNKEGGCKDPSKPSREYDKDDPDKDNPSFGRKNPSTNQTSFFANTSSFVSRHPSSNHGSNGTSDHQHSSKELSSHKNENKKRQRAESEEKCVQDYEEVLAKLDEIKRKIDARILSSVSAQSVINQLQRQKTELEDELSMLGLEPKRQKTTSPQKPQQLPKTPMTQGNSVTINNTSTNSYTITKKFP